MSLVWAMLDRASAGSRGLSMSPEGTRLLQDLRYQLLDRHAAPATAIHPAAVAAAA